MMAKPFVWDGVTYREAYEGPLRGETPIDLPTFSVYAWNDSGGSVSFPHHTSFEEAVAEIPALREQEREERDWEHWCVSRIERFARFTPMAIPGAATDEEATSE